MANKTMIALRLLCAAVAVLAEGPKVATSNGNIDFVVDAGKDVQMLVRDGSAITKVT